MIFIWEYPQGATPTSMMLKLPKPTTRVSVVYYLIYLTSYGTKYTNIFSIYHCNYRIQYHFFIEIRVASFDKKRNKLDLHSRSCSQDWM